MSGPNKVVVYNWRVTLEHRSGALQRVYAVTARSGFRAQRMARTLLHQESVDKNKVALRPKNWAMVGLVRLS